MRLITGTGLALGTAFAVGVLAGVWWLMVGPIAGVLVWSALADRSSRRHGWTEAPKMPDQPREVRWTSRN